MAGVTHRRAGVTGRHQKRKSGSVIHAERNFSRGALGNSTEAVHNARDVLNAIAQDELNNLAVARLILFLFSILVVLFSGGDDATRS